MSIEQHRSSSNKLSGMSTQQHQPANTVIKSSLSIEIPAIDIASYVFSSGTTISRGAPQYYDAESPSRNYSLAQAEIHVKRFARGLQNLGLRPGDRVLLYSGNRLFFPVVLWSVAAAGMVFTAASPTASASAWTDIWASTEDVRIWTWEKLTDLEKVKSTTAVINYSSGTTGLPKGVEISHYNLVANSEQLLYKRNLVAKNSSGRARKERLDGSGERWLAPLPMYHAFGQAYSCMNAPRAGAKVFIMSKFTVAKYLQFLDIYRITLMTTVPTILSMISKYEQRQHFNLKSIEVVTSGSAPLDEQLASSIAQKYLRSGVYVKQGWGMTETTCSVCGFSPDDIDDGRSIGWLNPNCALKIVPISEDDSVSAASRPSSTIGEIWVAGPQMMKGYWRNDKATQEIIVEDGQYRWVRTGDVGYVDARGCVYIVDRIKELIKVKGLQVAPAELAMALCSYAGVVDAAVVGASINGNEYPRAFVVRKDESVTVEALHNFIRSRFAAHKWLTGGIYFLEAIPRIPSGKVKKRDLPSIEGKVLARL
ncbi:hypothetical protein LTR06_011230 [Exophiala xenobiotica]|nr:hypothetical protein LTR06_011230 [Exophiala xenobiotica]